MSCAPLASHGRLCCGVLVLVLLRPFGAEALAAAGEASRATAARAAAGGLASAAGRSSEIPTWKLDEVYDPATFISGEDTGDSLRITPGAMGEAMGSTPAQDQQRCPILKLPADITLVAGSLHWLYGHRNGKWQGLHDIGIGSWKEGVAIGSGPDAMYIADVDGRVALKAVWLTEEELRNTYSWTLNPAGVAPVGSGAVAALVDCAGYLLFVVLVRKKGYVQGEPGGINIYDRAGSLLVHTIEDYQVSKQQFVDGTGYLLATSESPGLGANLPRSFLVPDPGKGNILPFGLHFELSGYDGASSLLDVDYRYAIAAAVQLRAVYDASPTSFPSSGLSGKSLPNVLPRGSGGLSGTVGYRPGDDFAPPHVDVASAVADSAAVGKVPLSNASAADDAPDDAGTGYTTPTMRPSRAGVICILSMLTACFVLGVLFCFGQLLHGVVYPPEDDGGGIIMAPRNPFIMWAPGALSAEKRRLLTGGGLEYS